MGVDRRPYYISILIFSILIAGSLYLSWAADRGLGELTIERMRIEREPGRPVDFLVYSPRFPNYGQPRPVILTTHGVAGSKTGMYAFNIELARRNFTVISVDLAGHGDSPLPFNITDISTMAEDCYAALRYVQTTRDDVDNTTYGMLTHSLGFQIAIEMQDYPIAPRGYAAVGYIWEMNLQVITDFPGNLIIAIGEYDEMISNEQALDAIRTATGNESAEAGVTYGSFENQTAYKLAFAPTDHVFEAIDSTVVKDATEWLVRSVQGDTQYAKTLPADQQVYVGKTIAMAVGVFSLLASTIPLLLAILSHLPERIRPQPIPNESKIIKLPKLFLISSIIGIGMVLTFSVSTIIGYHLENAKIVLIHSMWATGISIFFIIAPLIIAFLIIILTGKQNAKRVFSSVGIQKESIVNYGKRLLRAIIPAFICIVWLVIWMSFGGIPDIMTPWVIFSMVRYPVGVRVSYILILTIIGILFFVADAAWIRGLLMPQRFDNEKHSFSKRVFIAFGFRLLAVAATSLVVVFGITALGYVAGEMVLLGLLLLLFLVVSTLTTLLIALSEQEAKNPWPAIILSAFILSWVFISSIPLI